MATRWEIFVEALTEEDFALRATTAAFQEMQRLETALSRFIESSDINRLNKARGEPLVVNPDVWDILRVCDDMSRATGGAFDACFRSPREALDAVRESGAFEFDAARHAVRLRDPGLELDLGAVGKGFALDRMGALLEDDWDLARAMLHGGRSTVLALAAPNGRAGWPVALRTAGGREVVRLARCAVSASGFDVKGSHIVDPRTGERVRRYVGTWSRAPSAAVADALSTAFAVMSPDDVARWIDAHPGTAARLILESDGGEVMKELGSFG
jgi:thiamine biosynthesis lipoprotein